jgi:hypothetical protein
LQGGEERFEVAEVGQNLPEEDAEVKLTVGVWFGIADFAEDHFVLAVDADGGTGRYVDGAEKAQAIGGHVNHQAWDFVGAKVGGRVIAQNLNGQIAFKLYATVFPPFHIEHFDCPSPGLRVFPAKQR